jgi:hypothetical protein
MSDLDAEIYLSTGKHGWEQETVIVNGLVFQVDPDTARMIEAIAGDESRYAIQDCKTGDWVY